MVIWDEALNLQSAESRLKVSARILREEELYPVLKDYGKDLENTFLQKGFPKIRAAS